MRLEAEFLRGLVARGLRGVQLVISDAHEGLRRAIAEVLAGASWQRSRVHFMRNLLQKVPKHAQGAVAALVRTIFAQPDLEAARRQLDQLSASLQRRFPQVAQMLQEAAEEVLTYLHFPQEP
jgi:transposase-like protein